MPKRLPADLLDQVVRLLGNHPSGMSIGEIEASFRGVVSRRTLRRRLDEWVGLRQLRGEGVRRGRRYFIAEAAQPVPVAGIPISIPGQQIQAFVRRPLADRSPVGYQRTLLEGYVPNETAWLPEVIRMHLQALGRTPDEARPAGTYARDILDRLLIDLSWSSSRLEGNTYSLLDTRELIERGTVAAGKDAKETQMILNHKAAIELLVDADEEIGVNRFTIANLHALLADNLLDDPRNAGRLRVTPVAIAASTYLPTAVPQLIEEMFILLLEKGSAIQDPFEQSFFLMVHIPYLQPFVDINKRTSRLASNIPLIRRNLVPLSFLDVPEQTYVEGLIGIYELNRVELLRDLYVWAYERSVRQYKAVRDSLPEPDPIRLRYRAALIEVVGAVVRRQIPGTEEAIAELVRDTVGIQDLSRFTQVVQQELAGLHEGNIARFRLRPSEFQRWHRLSEQAV